MKIKILDYLKDGVDFIDNIPSTPALLIGIAIGAIIPFKLIIFCAIGAAIWAAIKYIEF